MDVYFYSSVCDNVRSCASSGNLLYIHPRARLCHFTSPSTLVYMHPCLDRMWLTVRCLRYGSCNSWVEYTDWRGHYHHITSFLLNSPSHKPASTVCILCPSTQLERHTQPKCNISLYNTVELERFSKIGRSLHKEIFKYNALFIISIKYIVIVRTFHWSNHYIMLWFWYHQASIINTDIHNKLGLANNHEMVSVCR